MSYVVYNHYLKHIKKKIELFLASYLKSIYHMGELREDGIWPKDEDGGKYFSKALNNFLNIIEKEKIYPDKHKGDIFLSE